MSRSLLALSLVLALSALARAAAPPAVPSPALIAAWVTQLGDDEANVRRSAAVKLRAAGEHAEAALEKAAQSDDAEVRRRARPILADLRRGVFPDTPASVVELIGGYENAPNGEKAPHIRLLLAAGRHGCRALARLARHEKDENARKEIMLHVFDGLANTAPSLFEDDASLEAVLELALLAEGKIGIAHFAAHHLIKGTLPAQIARIERQVKGKSDAKHEHETLASLYRANGQLDKAQQAAKLSERDELYEAMLFERADWKALVEKRELNVGGDKVREAGVRAVYGRLAGDEAAYLAAVKDLVALGERAADVQAPALPVAKALMFNAQHDAALKVLSKAGLDIEGTRLRLRFDLHVARLHFKEAAALVEKAREDKSAELPSVELAHARVLHGLGKKDAALKIAKDYAEKAENEPEAAWLADLVETQLVLDRRDEAFALAAKLLKSQNDPSLSARLFAKLFRNDVEPAASLWVLLRRPPVKLEHAAALKKLRELLDGKGTKKDIEDIWRAAENPPPDVVGTDLGAPWRAAGEAALRCKQDALAVECFTRSRSARGTTRLGDLQAAKAEWEEAAALYLRAFRMPSKVEAGDDEAEMSGDKSLALALYLHGHALVKAGKKVEGQRRIEQAHRLPLGDCIGRYQFARDLLRRGHKTAAAREAEYIRRLGQPILTESEAFYTGEGRRLMAIRAASAKRYRESADAYEQAFLCVLNLDLVFESNAAFVTVPALLTRSRALALAQAGKFDDALHEVKRNRQIYAGDVELPMHLVPLLDAKGRTKDADAVYDAVKMEYAKLIEEYPDSPLMRNQIAWLAATCRRDLKDALTHARKAVELSPKSAAFQDTLAEVLFQNGKKDDAVAAQKKAVELEPKREYFKKQLKRIEAGDPKAALPEEDDDE